jgi:hypothetical protein
MQKIVGISGKAGSGKTTFAKEAIRMYGGVKMALADAVKEEVEMFLQLVEVPYRKENLYGTAKDREEQLLIPANMLHNIDERLRLILSAYFGIRGNGMVGTFRHLLQLWGTEYRRADNPDYWVDRLRDKIMCCQEVDIYVDDVRFESEAEAIKSWGGLLVRVERCGGPFISTPNHPSETALDKYEGFDEFMHNYGSLGQFKSETIKLVGGM